uniref:Macaca fascicularis brain cDNA, clone: QflA-17243 n=1 Tax=Macaca fascicularis TaxID=9541 RepID=I7G5C6_MACFA|nr:unnamed protein product [Macaca fascicularis]
MGQNNFYSTKLERNLKGTLSSCSLGTNTATGARHKMSS